MIKFILQIILYSFICYYSQLNSCFAQNFSQEFSNDFSKKSPCAERLLPVIKTHGTKNNNTNDGSIHLKMLDGMPPFSYQWSNGSTTSDIINIPNGAYCVTVTDSLGCLGFACDVISILNKSTSQSSNTNNPSNIHCDSIMNEESSVDVTGLWSGKNLTDLINRTRIEHHQPPLSEAELNNLKLGSEKYVSIKLEDPEDNFHVIKYNEEIKRKINKGVSYLWYWSVTPKSHSSNYSTQLCFALSTFDFDGDETIYAPIHFPIKVLSKKTFFDKMKDMILDPKTCIPLLISVVSLLISIFLYKKK